MTRSESLGKQEDNRGPEVPITDGPNSSYFRRRGTLLSVLKISRMKKNWRRSGDLRTKGNTLEFVRLKSQEQPGQRSYQDHMNGKVELNGIREQDARKVTQDTLPGF
jgi:hypothetical protein